MTQGVRAWQPAVDPALIGRSADAKQMLDFSLVRRHSRSPARPRSHYFDTAIDFRNSEMLYAKNATPIAVTIANCFHTASKPPPR